MSGLIVEKVGMSRVVSPTGEMIPVTLLKIVDQKVTKVLTAEKDSYEGIQVGFAPKAAHRLTKADTTRLRKASIPENFSKFKEIRPSTKPTDEKSPVVLNLGDALDAKLLDGVTSVDITGVSRGRGFTGAITRCGHQTGRMTHGSHFHRRPGSLGMRSTPGRVFKNKGNPGQYGNVTRTVQNLAVVELNMELNLLAVKGSVPGHKSGYLFVRPSIKS